MKQGSKANRHGVSRRDFLKATSASAAFAAPALMPSSVFGMNAPSNRINVGVIGTGTRGTPDMEILMRFDDVQVKAICDVNTASLGYRDEKRLMGREPALKIVNEYYASKTKSGQFKGVKSFVG